MMIRLNHLVAALALASQSMVATAALAEQDGARDRPRQGPTDRGPGQAQDRPGRERPVDESRWQERLPADDRAALDVLIGYAAPEFGDDLRWFHGEKVSIESLRGKVVVIQSFNGRAARTLPLRVASTIGDRLEKGVALLALHVPDGADRGEALIERLDVDFPVLLDASGVTSDRFGMFRRPVNVVIDRVGNVRHAGLSDRGLELAVDALLAEPFDAETKPNVRAAPTDPTDVEVRWPTFTDPLRSARDLRGQPSPPFHVAEWIKDGGEPDGRLTVLDFWATWCGPCLRMIPHMNELATHYGDRVFVVGISDEARGAFNRGMIQRNLRLSGFEYHLALDPDRRMYSVFGIRGIPNIAVVSGDGIVRWQGHPQSLTRQVMDSLIEPNERLRSQGQTGTPTDAPPARWRVALAG